ncbi:MAG: Flp pilus assembly complex ATPase component TadA [Phycisphaeraceae bacterium]|nr:Flp pilus assembly complex ATPase component TadA [Phycisphaeraceae bacterium]
MPVLDSSQFLVRLLLQDGLLKQADVERASAHAKSAGVGLAEAIVSLGLLSSRVMSISRAKLTEYPFVDLSAFTVDITNASLLPRGVAERHGVFPLFVLDGLATVAMLDPLNLQAIDQVRNALRCDVDPVICDPEPLRALIARAYSMSTAKQDIGGAADALAERDLTTGDEPIVAAVNQILASAIESGASDVHIGPDEHDLHLRYRIDGTLAVQQGPAKAAHAGIVQRLKVMAKLDLTQTRKPQDGKFRYTHRGQYVDVRLSLVPTVHGENVVMRLLRSASSIGPISSLGMSEDVGRWYDQYVHRPHGMILVTGPTGSGKTTTLYTAINAINSPDRNILTIEDPVEIRLPLIRQVQANSEVGLTFASALRSFLRQDPDVVLVGEIRDAETARIAVQAALTGHLVLSTLHTNDAVGAIPRLRDFELPLFAINASLLCVLAQRLVRRVCETCAGPEPEKVPPSGFGIASEEMSRFVFGEGCASCKSSGYRGRLGVYEMLRMTPQVQHLIESRATAAEIRAAAEREGMRLMWQDGLEKARRGLTTVWELSKLRPIADDETGPELRCAA